MYIFYIKICGYISDILILREIYIFQKNGFILKEKLFRKYINIELILK